MDVAVITVGDELLSGDTVNTNATWLCEHLTERGATVKRVVVLPDQIEDIAQTVNEYRAAYDAVIVTGGIGPTHDDQTMEGVAAALGRDLIDQQEIKEYLETRGYAATDLTEGTTAIPAGARPLHNAVGVAPGAVVESVYVFPGVPAEMKAMFRSVAEEFNGTQQYTETITVDEPESALIGRLKTVRSKFDVTIGSYPGEYVRIKVMADNQEELADAIAWLQEQTVVVDETQAAED